MTYLNDEKIKYLTERAVAIRKTIIEALLSAGSGHSAGPLGMTDIFTALYFHILKQNPKDPLWGERDRLILSNGHICPVQYATLAHAGYFPIEEVKSLRKFGSRLQGHPHRETLPGLETSSGPLGSGLSQAVGMALAGRMDKKNTFFYCIMGDGELNAGQVWEALMLAGKEKLWNLISFIDRNNIQIDGFTEDIMPLEPLREKFEAFGWHVLEIDGHNFESIVNAVEEGKAIYEKPTMIIAHTIPGKGIDFMERKFEWHGKPPNAEEGKIALKQLRTLGGQITNESE